MTTQGFIKQEAFHAVFSNGQLGTEELADILYPNRSLVIPGQDVEKLQKSFFSLFSSESKAMITDHTKAGIFEGSYRNGLMLQKSTSQFHSAIDFSIFTSKKKKKKETVEKPALGLVNQPFPTIKSKLGDLTTIITDAPKARMPGEKKKMVRESIQIPTYNATQVSEGVITRPTVSQEADIAAFTPDQNIQKVLNSISPKDLLPQKDGGLSTNEIKEKAKELGIRVNNANRKALVAGIQEIMKKYRRDV